MRRFKIFLINGETRLEFDEADGYLCNPMSTHATLEYIQVDPETKACLMHGYLVGIPFLVIDQCPDIDPVEFFGAMERCKIINEQRTAQWIAIQEEMHKKIIKPDPTENGRDVA